jgi:hypothetical protein
MVKRRVGSQIDKSQIHNLTLDHKSLESKGQMKLDWSMLYIVGNIFSRVIRFFLTLSKQILFEKDMNVQNFGTPKILVLGFPFGSHGEK